jgi:hypothetical protein
MVNSSTQTEPAVIGKTISSKGSLDKDKCKKRKSEKVIRPWQFGSEQSASASTSRATPLNTPLTKSDSESEKLDYEEPLDFPETTQLTPALQAPRLTQSETEIRNAVASLNNVDFTNHGRYHEKKK